MDKERDKDRRNGREKEEGSDGQSKDITKAIQKDEILGQIVDSWKLEKPVDIMMADRMVKIWRQISKMEKKIEEQGLVVGIPPTLQPHPLIAKVNDMNTQLLSFYRTFQKKLPEGEGGPKDFADWIEGGSKNKK